VIDFDGRSVSSCSANSIRSCSRMRPQSINRRGRSTRSSSFRS
jgi:hypothetical protein